MRRYFCSHVVSSSTNPAFLLGTSVFSVHYMAANSDVFLEVHPFLKGNV